MLGLMLSGQTTDILPLLENVFRLIYFRMTYHKLGSISTGTSISKLHIIEAPMTWGTYNHGVPYHRVKYTAVKRQPSRCHGTDKATARVGCLTILRLQTDLLLPIFDIAVDRKWSHDQPPEHSSSCNIIDIGAIVQIVVSCREVVSPQWYPGSSNAAAAAAPETASYCYQQLVFDETPPTVGWWVSY